MMEYGDLRGLIPSRYVKNGPVMENIMEGDEDIDPSNMDEVIWPMENRCDPAQDIGITRKCWGSRLDSMTFTDQYYNSKAVIDACIPYEHIKDFATVAESSPQLRKTIFDKRPALMKELLSVK